MINIVLEGARGTGKSTVAKLLREKTTNSTLINHTGFDADGQEGLSLTTLYYKAWQSFFLRMRGTDSIFIHDRYFFSEFIYSRLYKEYEFPVDFKSVIEEFYDKMALVVLVADAETYEKRLTREKIQLFGRVTESKTESLFQQIQYLKLVRDLDELKNPIWNLKIHIISVNTKTPEEVAEEILALI